MLLVAAALVEREGRMLLARRPHGTHLAGQWEFPGGKLEPGESPATCLIRELQEELGVQAVRPTPFTFSHYRYVEREVLILLLRCGIIGEPQPLHASELGWFSLDEASKLHMPEADLPLLEFIAHAR